MLKETEAILLANSRLACTNSYWNPTIMGCIIISTIYLSMGSQLFSCAWIALAVICIMKKYKNIKVIRKEMEKDGS